MTTADLGRVQLRRINAFQGLMIDASIWRDAHDYHRSQVRLHNLALHGWGIAHGLEVALSSDRNTIVVQPGIAVDPAGNFIIVTEPYFHRIEAPRAGTVYLLIQFSELPAGPTQPPNDPHGQPTRVLEAYRILQRDSLSSDPRVELCRVDFDPLAGPITAPDDPTAPGTNELDLRFRIPIGAAGTVLPTTLASNVGWVTDPVVARAPEGGGSSAPPAAARNGAYGPAAAPGAAGAGAAARPITVVVARHGGQGWDAHGAGLAALARELGFAGRPTEVRETSLSDPDAEGADLVYLTGQSPLALGPAEVELLRQVVGRGGVVVGDGCASGPRGDGGARDFARSFSGLADQLGRRLEAVERGHPALASRHLFAAPPAGARASTVLLADGAGKVLYCDADYGCAWGGGPPQQPLQRGAIRDATELGVNLAFLPM